MNQSDIEQLIQGAASAAPTRQPNGNYARVITANQTVGFDVAEGLYTKVYTVITDSRGKLVTAHPGYPR